MEMTPGNATHDASGSNTYTEESDGERMDTAPGNATREASPLAEINPEITSDSAIHVALQPPEQADIHSNPSTLQSSWWTNHRSVRAIFEERGNALMIVATVIATMTFQSLLNPPGGFWQETTNSTRPGFSCGKNNTICLAGTPVLAYLLPIGEQLPSLPIDLVWLAFNAFNTVSFFSSVAVILLHIVDPVRTLQLTLAMCFTLLLLVGSYIAGLLLVNSDQIDKLIPFVTCCFIVLILFVGGPVFIGILENVRSHCRRGAREEGGAPLNDV